MKKVINVTAYIYILVGLLMIISPKTVSDFICFLIGGIILLFSSNQIFSFIRDKRSKFKLVLGVLTLILGSYIILNPEEFISFIPFVAGVIIIIDSVSKIVQSVDLRKYGYANWSKITITSLLMLLFGLFLLFNPFGAIEIVIRILGIFLIIDGVCEAITVKAIHEKKVNTNVKKDKKKVIEAEIVE